MVKLEINFSPEYEERRIRYTLDKLQWFTDNKYRIDLPEKLQIAFNNLHNISISENQIKNAVISEYNELDYETQKDFLIKNWQKVIEEASTELAKTLLTPENIYVVYLTKYGVGGSYNLPNAVIVNIKHKYGSGLLRTVFHEMLHLIIHGWITKYKINHWQKERIVDLLMIKFVPQLSKPQQLPIEIGDIDKLFNKFYPNIELVIKNIGLLLLK